MDKSELQEWEYKCIQEEPPQCMSGCPIHVDARLFVKQVSQEKWEEAMKTLAKTMPFPKILGRICDHPCEPVCKRGEVEQPIAIGNLERACVETALEKVKGVILGRKQTTVAVIGSGLSSLTVVWDLLRKGYQVSIFEPGQRLGRNLWDYPESILPPEIISEELSVLENIGATIALSTDIGAGDFIADLQKKFDAVFVGLDSPGLNSSILEHEENGRVRYDPLTKATSLNGVFAGGDYSSDGHPSPIYDVLDGRRAATSIDRYSMNSSMDNGRELEGPYTSRLYTNIEGIAPLERILPADPIHGYSSEEAITEAGRCIQCECLECVKVCLFLDRYKGYPKKYARQVFNNEYVMFSRAHTKNLFVNSCSRCGLCKTVCPNDFYMGDLTLQARQTMLEKKTMPPSFHEFALQDMAHSNSERFALSRHDPGKDQSAWLYFPSCQLCATSPGEVENSYAYLREKLDGGVGIMLRCCGAPAFWAGRNDLFNEAQAAIRREWEQLGKPNVITACSTCRSLFADHLPELETHTLWEIVEKNGLPERDLVCCDPAETKSISIADPCITRHDRETQEVVRRIVRSLGYSVDELSMSGPKPECCGFGGLMFNADPALARDVIKHRTTTIDPSDTALYHTSVKDNDYLAYCAMCRDNLVAGGKRTSHLIEHLFPTVAGSDPAARGWISWSERRTNRTRVKENILREPGDSEGGKMEITLRMTPEVRRRIDDRRILEGDIKKVIDHGERTGKRLQSLQSEVYRTYLQSENVTFWVDYTPADYGFTVHNAYCHRMKIVGVKL